MWLGNRQENYENWNDIRKTQGNLLTIDYETLNYSLGTFVTEFCKENGEEYRGNTLYEILVTVAIILHYLLENGRCVTLVDNNWTEGIRKMLDKINKRFASSGNGMREDSRILYQWLMKMIYFGPIHKTNWETLYCSCLDLILLCG